MPATNKNKKSIFRYAWFIPFLLNILAIFALFASVLAWWVSPITTTVFAYLGLGFVFILVANILFFLFWLVFAKWKFAIATFVSLFICSIPIFTFFPVHFRTSDVPPDSIKVLSYNVRGFSVLDVSNDTEINPTLDYIRKSDADIVCIQEFMLLSHRKDTNKKKVLQMMKDYPYHSFTKLSSVHDNSSGYMYGMVCFSKYPILETKKLPIKTIETAGAVMYKIKINGKVVSVFNNHLESNLITAEDRQMYREILSKDADRAKIDDFAHIVRQRLGTAFKKRVPQALLLHEEIEKQNTDAVIVCGDFNDTPISYTYKTIRGKLKDSFVETGFGAGITYNENRFWFRIDYILHSDNMKAYNCTVDKVNYSDHYPIYTYLTFK